MIEYPDTRDQDLGANTLQHVPILAYHPAREVEGFGIVGPMVEVIMNDERRLIPIDPTGLEQLDPNNIDPSIDFLEIVGQTTIGSKVDNLVGRHIRQLKPKQQQKLTEYPAKTHPAIEASMPKRPGGETRQPDVLSQAATARARMSNSASKALNRIDDLIAGLFPAPGDVFKAAAQGAVHTALHLKSIPKGSSEPSGAVLKSGGSSIDVGKGGAGINAGTVEMSCTPDNVTNSHLAPNPLLHNLGPSTTMNPFPPYLINVGKFIIGVYAITRALNGLGGK